jgi:Ni/Fe-hydrogenase subunit HybB-like protein
MPDDSPRPTRHAGYASAEPTKPPNWHGLVAWDILFNNLTTGLYMVVAVAELARPGVFLPLTKYAYPLALALLTADLLCLVLDLGDPLRFHHMLRVFKPSSPMSLGTWSLTFYSLPLTLLAAFGLFGVGGWVRTIAVVIGLPFALGSAAYKGVLFSTTAQPGWRDARWLGGYFVSAALMLGAMELLVLADLIGLHEAANLLRPATGVLLVVNLIPMGLLLAELGPTLDRLGGRGRWFGHGLLVATLGVLVPLGLLAVARGTISIVGAAASLLVASYLIRHGLVMIPHLIHEP